jgi:hypothetical protein
MSFDGTKPANNSALVSAEVRANLQDLDTRAKPLATFQSTVGNVGTGEDTLASFSIPAGTLPSNGASVKGIFWGKSASNANAKTLRVRLIEGANNLILIGATLTVSEAGHWMLGFVAMRTGATTFRAATQMIAGPGNGQITKSVAFVTPSSTVTWANAVEARLTGEATADNDVTMEGGYIELAGV